MTSTTQQIPQAPLINQMHSNSGQLLLTTRELNKDSPSGVNYIFNTPFPFRDLRPNDKFTNSIDNAASNNFIARLRPPMILPNIHVLDSSSKLSEVNMTNSTLQPINLTPSSVNRPNFVSLSTTSDRDKPNSYTISQDTAIQKSNIPTNGTSGLMNSIANGSSVSLSSFPNRTFLFRNSTTEPHKFLSNSFLRNQSAKRHPPITPALPLGLGKQNDMKNRFIATAFPSGVQSIEAEKSVQIESQIVNQTSFENYSTSTISTILSNGTSSRLSTPLTEEGGKGREKDVHEAEKIRMPVTGTITGTVYQRIASKSAALLYTPSKTSQKVSQNSYEEPKIEHLTKLSGGSFTSRENLRRQIQRDVEELKKLSGISRTVNSNANTLESPAEMAVSFKNKLESPVSAQSSDQLKQAVPKVTNFCKQNIPPKEGDNHSISSIGKSKSVPTALNQLNGVNHKEYSEVSNLVKHDPLSSACSSTANSSDEDDSDDGSTAEIETEEEENNQPSSRSHSLERPRSKSASSFRSGSVSRLTSSSSVKQSSRNETSSSESSEEDRESTKESSISTTSKSTSKELKSCLKTYRSRPTSAGSYAQKRRAVSSGSDWEHLDGSNKDLLITLTTDKPGGVKSPLIASLFPRVPPTIRFVTANEKLDSLPWQFRKLLKWRMSVITPLIVKNIISRSGFRSSTQCASVTELESATTADWIGYFGRHCKAHVFRTIREHQKVNHFPGSFQLGRKDRLWRNLSRMQSQYGKKEYGFFPETFCLPADLKELKEVFDTEPSGKQKWIIKPPASARGIGIRVVHKWSQIPKQKAVIVQRYLSNPYLINGSKFDLRIYVYVTSFNPLRAYVYNDGLVRFASVPYSNSLHTLHNRFIHLTNYSINKFNAAAYVENNGDGNGTQTSHKWSLKDLWQYFDSAGIQSSKIINNIHDLVVKTLIAGESHISSDVEEYCRGSQCVHELFGFDVLLDADLKPWILECNISPSLHSDSKLDVKVKGALIRDVFNLAGFVLPRSSDIIMDNGDDSYSSSGNNRHGITQDPKFHWESELTNSEQKKQDFYVIKATEQFTSYWEDKSSNKETNRNRLKCFQPDRSILDSLNTADIRCLVTTIDEFQRIGDFTRVFPPKDREKHCHYMTLTEEPVKYYNFLLWSYYFHYHDKNSLNGIQLLQNLCRKGHHLRRHSSLSSSRRS